jgi:acetyl-CoA acetyltransferase
VFGSGIDIIGIGETEYFKRGGATEPEFLMACKAVVRAADDAGIDPRDIDGFASYANDRNDGIHLARALDVREVNFTNLVWGGGGGGCTAAVANAGAAITAGLAKYVVVYRSLAQGQFGRFGRGGGYPTAGVNPYADFYPYGMMAPAHGIAMHTRRFMDRYGVSQDPLAAIALASYDHAQRNPRAVMYGRSLTREKYDASRWIAEPFHLYDCCQETDGAAAVILTSSDRARGARHAVPVLAAAQGTERRHLAADASCGGYTTGNFQHVAARLWERAGIGPDDIDVVQAYENFTGGVMMALVDHGFCTAEAVNEFMTPKTFSWDGGQLPLNTSGGNLAEAYVHGLELVNEAVRQMRGESTCQVKDASTALVIGGPRDAPVSNLILTKAG